MLPDINEPKFHIYHLVFLFILFIILAGIVTILIDESKNHNTLVKEINLLNK